MPFSAWKNLFFFVENDSLVIFKPTIQIYNLKKISEGEKLFIMLWWVIEKMSDITEYIGNRIFSSYSLTSARKSERKLGKIYRNILIFDEIIFGHFIRTYPNESLSYLKVFLKEILAKRIL